MVPPPEKNMICSIKLIVPILNCPLQTFDYELIIFNFKDSGSFDNVVFVLLLSSGFKQFFGGGSMILPAPK